MNDAKPQRLAAWLLEHTSVGASNGALAGDLLEEFRRRRSATWYWRQVLLAIVVGWASEVRRHPALTVQAILITLLVNFAALRLGRVAIPLGRPILQLQFASWGVCFVGGVLSGAAVSLLYRKHRPLLVLTAAAALLPWAMTVFLILKSGAIHHHPWKIVLTGTVYCLVALAGFALGAPVRQRPFAAN